MRTTVKLPSFSNIAAGNTDTLELPKVRTGITVIFSKLTNNAYA